MTIDGLIEEMVIRADLPANVEAEEYTNGSDMATIGHFENWRIGVRTGRPGGDYQNTNLGNAEWTAKLIAVLLNHHANGVRPTAPVSTTGTLPSVPECCYGGKLNALCVSKCAHVKDKIFPIIDALQSGGTVSAKQERQP